MFYELYSINNSDNFQMFLSKLVWDLVYVLNIEYKTPKELKMHMCIISHKYSQTRHAIDG